MRPGAHRRRPKPLLASEVLCDELAPVHPARGVCRLWFAGIAVAMALLGCALRFGLGASSLGADASTVTFSSAGAVLAVALLPFPYALRAGVVAALGGGLFALGIRGAGPLTALAGATPLQELDRVIALCALPAALLFRANYRAYPGARRVLIVALVCAAPFLLSEIRLLADASQSLLGRAAAVASVIVILFSLLGFMGDGSTGAGSVVAGAILVVLPAALSVSELQRALSGEPVAWTGSATAIAVAAAGSLVSVGIFQILASALAGDARRIAKKPQGQNATGA